MLHRSLAVQLRKRPLTTTDFAQLVDWSEQNEFIKTKGEQLLSLSEGWDDSVNFGPMKGGLYQYPDPKCFLRYHGAPINANIIFFLQILVVKIALWKNFQ